MPITRGTRRYPVLAGAEAATVAYLLRATFDAADQGYADAQVLDTLAEGVQDGQLTVVEVDGTLAISSNKCAFTAQSTPAWGDLGFYSQAITRALGRGLLGTVNLSTWEEMGLGWHSAAAVVDPDSIKHAIQANTTDGRLDTETGIAIYTGLSLNTNYPLAVVLGGFDSSATPYYTGQTKSSYDYGAWYFLKVGGNWTLVWLDTADNTATLYAMLASLDAVGSMDSLKVPDSDLSAVQAALVCFDSFTDTNGTSLDAHTMDHGGLTWTEVALGGSPDFDIQSNKCRLNNGVGGWGFAYVDVGISDVVMDVNATTDSDTGSSPGFIARYVDTDNYWRIRLYTSDNTWKLIEKNAGTATVRAGTSVTANQNTTYSLRIILDGQTIDGFVDGGDKISYGSASLNETATKHGISDATGSVDDDYFDNFAIFPRTSSTYDSSLNGV